VNLSLRLTKKVIFYEIARPALGRLAMTEKKLKNLEKRKIKKIERKG